MKITHINYRKIMVLALLLQVFCVAWTQKIEERKTIRREFSVMPGLKVELSNKYGILNIQSWDNDSVVIEVETILRAKDQVKLAKIKQELDIQFIRTSHFLVVTSVFGAKGKDLMKDLSSTVLQGSNNAIEINYNVWIPKNLSLKAMNKYGDVFTSDLDGNIELVVSYGNLKSHDLSGTSNIQVNFGDADIRYMKSGKLDVNFADVTIEKIDKASIVSKSSSLDIKAADYLTLDSKRDKYILGKVINLNGNTMFSDIRLTALAESFTSSMKYGEIEISSMNQDFKQIVINSKFTDIHLTLSNHSYNYEITYSKTQFDVPINNEVFKEEVIDEKLQKYKVSGIFGTNKNPESRITINAEYGELIIY